MKLVLYPGNEDCMFLWKFSTCPNRGQSITLLRVCSNFVYISVIWSTRGLYKNLYTTGLTLSVLCGAESFLRSQYFLRLSVFSPILWNQKSHRRFIRTCCRFVPWAKLIHRIFSHLTSLKPVLDLTFANYKLTYNLYIDANLFLSLR
jgi:hypothetical protein